MKRTNLFKTNLIAILMVFLAFTACNIPEQNKEKESEGPQPVELIESEKDLTGVNVGYSSPLLDAPFFVVLSESIGNNAKAYGMNYFSVDGRGDITEQIKGIEDLISRGVEVLIINPLDPKALVPSINAASKSGVPVFVVDSFIDKDADYITSVLAANSGNGDLLGNYIAEQMRNQEVKMAVISGAQGNPVGRNKRTGFISGFSDAQLRINGKTNFDIVSQGWGGWSISGGQAAMEDILVAHPEINLVVAENDAMAMGALRAIEGAKRADDILVIGFDAQKEALKLILDGELAATAQNSPTELGKLVVQSVVRYLNGETTKGVVTHTPAVLINKSNVNQFYDANAPF